VGISELTETPKVPLWAKLRRVDEFQARREFRAAVGQVAAWRSLVDHSADVAAVFEAILSTSVVLSRLERLAERPICEAQLSRLGVLAAIHDFGKANRGFQARWNAHAENIGHVREAWVALNDRRTLPSLAESLPLRDIERWHGLGPILLAIAHHGVPLNPEAPGPDDKAIWTRTGSGDPVGSLAPLGKAIRGWFLSAFDESATPCFEAPFWHLISGFLTLADWIASDEKLFPLAGVNEPEIGIPRFQQSKAYAAQVLHKIGFDPSVSRHALPMQIAFSAICEHPPRPIQLAAGEIDDSRIVVLESETGSGKTEAALFRFARLFAAGAVDGLYFALPTRVAATALYARVAAAVCRIWPDALTRPAVVLAVPGQENLPDQGLEAPAGGHDAWEGGTNNRETVWAGSRPKKFLAGTIAVGTIDQALLGIIKAKHAHLRLACLTRHLLVVDEVHASDRYMESLLAGLLRFQRRVGGHALLLSATLGARAREKLLGRSGPSSFAAAISAPYPSVSTDTKTEVIGQSWEGVAKEVALAASPAISEPTEVAALAVEAARKGAKVLVVRNLRRDAIAVFEALIAIASKALVFSCHGVPTLHHGRFAREDRPRLDAALEAAIGKVRAPGGLVVVGTQTLEQSLDICADYLISDIAPADVLLQRLGRLHRHARSDRPAEYRRPRATILVPPDIAALIGRPMHGLGANDRFAMPYPDLIAIEATRRLISEHPLWSIPSQNRELVEAVTHPEARAAVMSSLASDAEDWAKADAIAEGRVFAHLQAGAASILRTDVGFENADVCFPYDERVATRLGAMDALVELPQPVEGPFAAPVRGFLIPRYWGVDPGAEIAPRVQAGAGYVTFDVQDRAFRYDLRGLRPIRRP
jgi:CRISPR-associated endonuclease/helicase Cas3